MAKKATKRKKSVKRRKPVILPMKLSSLIRICLKDIRKAEKEPKKYVVDMATWFKPETVVCETDDGVVLDTFDVCTLCAAGSVMAFSLGALTRHGRGELTPEQFRGNSAQLNAINLLRDGDAHRAARQLFPGTTVDYSFIPSSEEKLATKFDRGIPAYRRDKPEPFHRAMTKFQTDLAKAGL